MRKIFSVAILLSVLSFALAAEEELASPSALFPSSVGVFGSVESMGGLSYQRWFGPVGLAITGGAMAETYSSSYGNTMYSYPMNASPSANPDFYTWNYNAEVDVLYKLYSSNFWNWLSGDLFAYAKVAHHGGVSAGSTYTPNVDTTKPGTTVYYPNPFTPVFAAGIGIGYEITLFQHFSIPLLFGYTAEYPLRLNFDFGGGLRYRY